MILLKTCNIKIYDEDLPIDLDIHDILCERVSNLG